MALKFGRKPAVHTARTMRSALAMAKALDPLGAPPPASNDYVSAVTVPWQMFLNDSLGDCVCADSAHSLMLRTANAGSIIVPTDDDVLSLYEAVGGYKPDDPSTDQGCDETSMCQYLMQMGFLGHLSDGTGMIDPASLNHIKWCVQLFGTCRIGFNVPAFAMDQFDSGNPWDLDPSGDQTIQGGHDVPVVRYDGGMFYVVTWGKVQAMTPAFFSAFTEEAHAEIFSDWTRAGGLAPSGLELGDLVADLKDVAA